MLAVGDRQALARHGGEADDRALAGLAVDLGQHDVGRGLGERALALDRRQLAGVAQHQDRLAEGEQVARHVVADHRHLVEHDQRGVADDRLLVEHEARLVDVVEPDLEAPEPRLLEQADGGIECRQLRPDLGDLLLDPLDLVGRRLRDAVDQAVDRRGGGALAGHDQRRLAGERGVEHAVARQPRTPFALLRHRLEPELVDGVPGDGGLPDTGVAEHPEHLLLRGPVQEPVLDRADRLGLQVGGREALAHA